MTAKGPKASTTTGLNVYKKVAIIRKADDVLTYEDSEGVKTITDLHLAAAATVSIDSERSINKYWFLVLTPLLLSFCRHPSTRRNPKTISRFLKSET